MANRGQDRLLDADGMSPAGIYGYLLELQRSIGNRGVVQLLAETDVKRCRATVADPIVQRTPTAWASDHRVTAINRFTGSAQFWKPVNQAVTDYSRLRDDDWQGRRTILARVERAIKSWRDHQATLWISLQSAKASSLLALGPLIAREKRELLPRNRLEQAGHSLSEVELEGLSFWSVDNGSVLIYERGMTYPEIADQALAFLDGSLDVYRGIPIGHKQYQAAKDGTVVPFGKGPPSFVTANSTYVPFADGLGECTAAAKSRKGESNPGQVGGTDSVVGFDETDPSQEVGIIVKVTISRSAAHSVAFFNPGELQVKGPVTCTTARILRVGD